MALVAAAYEAAARLCVPGAPTFIYEIAEHIRALTPAHALDVLQTMLTQAREDGQTAEQEYDKVFEKEAWEAGYEKAKEWCAQRCEWFASVVGAQEGHDLEVWSAKRCAEEIRAPGAWTKLMPPKNLRSDSPKKDPIR
jgi:Na+-translocating ferredoxin:NAD+ oxidoreductase RNF subunit RnfB